MKKIIAILIFLSLLVSCKQQEKEKAFHFYVATDVHMIKQRNDYTSLCFRDEILQDIKKDSTGIGKFIVVTGDMDPFFRVKESVEQVMGVDYRFYPVVGNHDVGYTNNDYIKYPDANWANAFDIVDYNRKNLKNIVSWGPEYPTPALDNLIYTDSLGKQHVTTYDSLGVKGSKYTSYSFDEGNSHFVVLDIYAGLRFKGAEHMGRISNELYEWLKNNLEKNKKENVFVFAHQPVWNANNSTSLVNGAYEDFCREKASNLKEDSLVWFTKEFTNKIRTTKELWSLFKKNNVVAYFCGHTHHFSAKNYDGVWEINMEFGAWEIEGRTRYAKILVTDNKVELGIMGFKANPNRFELIDKYILKGTEKN